MIQPNKPLHPARAAFDAVIFDLDGVVTDTATVHARAWKALFDEALPGLAKAPVPPFEIETDYRRYVDGRAREDGIRAFLASRGIEPAHGRATIDALAVRKQELFIRELAVGGVIAFPGTLALLRQLREQDLPVALVTSSRNSGAVLAAARVAGLFDVTVDGTDALRMHLAGKPDPALFLEAARRLHVTPDRTVVIEDSEAGVQAAARGGFALVIGMDRNGDDRLHSAGADLLLTDLADLDLVSLDPALTGKNRGWAGGESGSDPWLLRYIGYDPATEGLREALCTLGNGYWGSRGAAAESSDDGVHYPGTYLAGVYNRVQTDLGERTVEDEHLVNAPNWLPLGFRVADGDWFDVGRTELVTYLQELDLRRGLLTRVIRFRDGAGRTTRVTSRRFLSQAAPHVAVLDTTFEAEDWSGPLTVCSALEGRVFNRNVAADRLLSNTHLLPRTGAQIDPETVLLEMETTQSGIHIALAARTRVRRDEQPVDLPRHLLTDDAGWVAHEFTLDLEPGHPVRVEKTAVVSTSRDRAIASPARAAATWMRRLPDPADLLAAHELAWQVLWDEFAVGMHASEHQSLALNLNTFHVLQTVAAVDADLDASMPARGLHGEGYRGHVFWDELFVYPILTLRRPDLSRALLGYRYRRLGEARAAARGVGCEGAMFPWQSGIDGVMGPDEFHDGYPGTPGSGVRNNAYTNVMTAWVLRRAVDTVALLEDRCCQPLRNRLRLRPDEVDQWARISLRLRVPFHTDGVISQFEGYEDLPEFDWDSYRARYPSIARLDLILNAEGDSTNNYRLSKQADVLMLLYLLSAEELRDLLETMGYQLPPEAIVRTVEFYSARSTHGSTLSNVVHSWLDARRDRERSWDYLTRALDSDLGDILGGSTHEGIHLGAMAGSVDMVVRCYTGLEIREDMLWLHPVLPKELAEVTFAINYREQPIRLELTPGNLRLQLRTGGATPIRVRIEGEEAVLSPGETRDFPLG